MKRTAGVILAGGRGERLGGVIKANLVIGRRRLLDRVADRLAAADTLLIAHGPLSPMDLLLAPHQIGISDLATDYAGPLAGLAAAIDWGTRQADPPDIVVLAPVDTPFLPEDYWLRLLAALDQAPAAVASFAGQAFPTSSAWRWSAIETLPAGLRAGTAPRSLKGLAASLGAIDVAFPASAGGDPFANVNTPADLVALEQRAGHSG